MGKHETEKEIGSTREQWFAASLEALGIAKVVKVEVARFDSRVDYILEKLVPIERSFVDLEQDYWDGKLLVAGPDLNGRVRELQTKTVRIKGLKQR